MEEYKTLLGYLAICIAVIGYVLYIRGIARGTTKPHAFSWLVWGVLTGIAFVAQVVEKGGAGAWVTGVSAVVTLGIAGIAFTKGTRDFPLFDKVALVIAGVSIVLWWLTSRPILSIVLITIIDAIGFLPTFRKGYQYPHEETMSQYALSALKHIIGIMALESLTLTTWLYPASLVLMNGLFTTLLVVRRRRLKNV